MAANERGGRKYGTAANKRVESAMKRRKNGLAPPSILLSVHEQIGCRGPQGTRNALDGGKRRVARAGLELVLIRSVNAGLCGEGLLRHLSAGAAPFDDPAEGYLQGDHRQNVAAWARPIHRVTATRIRATYPGLHAPRQQVPTRGALPSGGGKELDRSAYKD